MKRLLLATACFIAFPALAQNAVVVNGEPITQNEVDQSVKAMVARGVPDNEKLRKTIINDLIDQKILYQQAIAKKLDQNDDVKFQIANNNRQILIRAFVEDWALNNKVSDDSIQKAYDELVKQNADVKEYHVKHILLKDEKSAADVLAQVKNEKITFAEAAEKSLDTGSAKQGGDLDWAVADNYVPEFAAAVKSAKKGELVSKPIKSQFGWHIIQVLDSRPVKIPSLEQLKPDLTKMLKQKQLQGYITELRNKAKIEKTAEPAKAEKTAEPAKAEKTAEPAKAEKTAEPAKAEKTAEPAKAEKTAEPAKAEKTAEPCQS